jgi:2-iminobutanoate/2-iminopropanoate deaminase
MKIRKIETPEAPSPAGHYSQGTIFNNIVFISGQLPVVPGTGEKILGSIEEQTTQVLKNIKSIVEAAGSSIDQVLKVTVYISDISLWGSVNNVYSEFFGTHKPARAIIPVKELHHGFMIEMEAIAAININA